MTSAVRESWLVRKTTTLMLFLSRKIGYAFAMVKFRSWAVFSALRRQLQAERFRWRDRARYLIRKKQRPQRELDGGEVEETKDTKEYLEEERTRALRSGRFVRQVYIDAKKGGVSRAQGNLVAAEPPS